MQNSAHMGHEFWFELYLLRDQLDKEAWSAIVLGISQYIGFLKIWRLIVSIDNSAVRYYVGVSCRIKVFCCKHQKHAENEVPVVYDICDAILGYTASPGQILNYW